MTGTTDFADRLAELEDRGSAVLVTGADAAAAHTALCRDLLATDSVKPRRRVIVAPNGTTGLDPRLPTEGGTVPDTTLVTTASGRGAAASDRSSAASDRSGAASGRDAAASGTPSAPRGVDVVTVDDASLEAFGAAITGAVERVRRDHGPLSPTELRIGVDSLAPLLDAHHEAHVFAFLVVLTRYARATEALGHCHLPVDRTAYAARLFAPLFDAVVEVRARGDHPQQRWHLDDGATTSPWLEL